MPTIYPSLIGADQLNLAQTIKNLDPHVVGYHLDVMDNHFVPNLTWGAPTVNAIAQITNRILWIHLMVTNPADWIDLLKLKPGSIFSFHAEALHDESAATIIASIKKKGWRASVAINPSTSVESIFNLLLLVDQVLVMSVQPGFSGQSFIADVVNKLKPLVEYRASHNLNFRIGMDGGIDENTIEMLAHNGVDDFAIASGIFAQPNPVAALELLNKKVCGNR
jgi:ribulose-phosphate 3-epimerase